MFAGSDGGVFRTDDARAVTAKGTTVACSLANSSVILRLPLMLAGRGETDIVLTVDGQAANVVKLSFK